MNNKNNLEFENRDIKDDINSIYQRNINAGLGKKGLGDVLGDEVSRAKEHDELEELNIREKYAGRNLVQEVEDLKIDESLPDEEIRKIIANALDCRPDQISFNREEALSGNDIIFHQGSLELTDLKSINGIKFPFAVNGYINIESIESVEDVVLPQLVGRWLGLRSLVSAKNLTLPILIGSTLDLQNLKSDEDLVLPQSIGDWLGLNKLESIDNPNFFNNVEVESFISFSRTFLDKYKDELEKRYPDLAGKFIGV